MSHKRLKPWQKATALVPLALLSGAWTTSLAVTGSASAATKDAPAALPDGTTIPDQAAEVINSADPSCNVTWQLIAAIGRVESDHGRYGGNVLDENGRSTPGIFGIPLDGSNGTASGTP